MKFIRLLAAMLGVVVPALLAAKPSSIRTESKASPFAFSILPKSLQKNPQVDCNVITEVTPLGKKIRPPTLEKPAYYVLQAGYYQNLGEAAPANAQPPPVDELSRLMIESLGSSHYLEAAPPRTLPTLLVVFSFGDHSATSGEAEDAEAANAAQTAHQQAMSDRAGMEASLGLSEEDSANLSPPPDPPSSISSGQNSAEELVALVLSDQRKYRQLIDRAGLVGGITFARELADVLKKEITYRSMNNASSSRLAELKKSEGERDSMVNAKATGQAAGPGEAYEPITTMVMASGPFHAFYQRNEKTMHLLEEAFGSCYFVIASAYDGAAFAQRGEKRLLWRTKMTVNSSGVRMADTLPVLIRTAGPYFGRDMAETATVTKRVLRTGKVGLGSATVLDHPVEKAATASDAPKAPTPEK